MQEIKVSIVCNTYNQESYIRDALESFIMQKTNFAFEILVHDDASTDGTADIVREYEAKYPDLIKPIYQTENQYSQKVKISRVFQFPRAEGKYIAFCEGDDYWTDPLKLQKQYDVLEAHPEVDICAHKAICVNAETKEIISEIKPAEEDGILKAEDVIFGEGWYVSTNSLMFRKSLNENIPQFRRDFGMDYTLQIHGALRGGMFYLDECMSAYRVMAKGSWTMSMKKDKVSRLNFFKRKQNMLLQLDEDTDFTYTPIIQKRMKENYFALGYTNGYKTILSKEYREFFRKLSFKERFKIRIKAYFPFLIKLKRKLKR